MKEIADAIVQLYYLCSTSVPLEDVEASQLQARTLENSNQLIQD
jgi:hypothetical protein